MHPEDVEAIDCSPENGLKVIPPHSSAVDKAPHGYSDNCSSLAGGLQADR